MDFLIKNGNGSSYYSTDVRQEGLGHTVHPLVPSSQPDCGESTLQMRNKKLGERNLKRLLRVSG